jgi:hypothetical protein
MTFLESQMVILHGNPEEEPQTDKVILEPIELKE